MKVETLLYLFSLFLCLFVLLSINAQDNKPERWTWLYHKRFSEQESIQNTQKKEILFSQTNVPFFSQLIFSWNAFRSLKGYFSFWVQVRNVHTKQWSDWHKMFDWGDALQSSYSSKDSENSKYIYVRLETGDNVADAFRIKTSVHDGADLSLLKGFTVSLSDFNNFRFELGTQWISHLPFVCIKNVPKYSQFALNHSQKQRLCSPTSCSMLVSFLLNQAVDPIDFAEHSFDSGLDAYGSWPFNIAHAFERCEGKVCFFTARLNSFLHLYKYVQKGIPVVVSVRGPLEGAPKLYKEGHLLVVIGWDPQKRAVICHDPAFESHDNVLKQYPIKSFLHAWERSRRLAYIAEPV